MATKVLLKKSSVPNKVPLVTDLEYGELALNYADGKLYFKTPENEIEYIGGDLTELGTVTQGTWNANVIQIAYGGTGASTRAAAINNLLPNQSTADGFYLTTDGTNVSWQEIGGGIGNLSDSSVYLNTFTGDGSTTIFEISVTPQNDQSVFVSINGVLQDPSTYSIAGTSLQFSTAPATGDNIDIRTITVVSTKLSLRDFQKYFYTIESLTTTIAGTDDNGLVLEYDSGKLDVYQNGVRLVEGADYVATNGTSITFTTTLDDGDTVEVLTYSAAFFLNNPTTLNSEELTTTVSNQAVDSFAASEYRTVKYLIQAVSGSHVHSTEVLVMHNDTDTFITEYATMHSSVSPLITVTATLESGVVYLKVTPANINTTVDFARTSITARTLS
jgi:hypothetical protein